MSEFSTLKNKLSLTGSEDYVGKPKISIVEGKKDFFTILSPTSEESIKIRFTAHHMKWAWKITGSTNRTPIKVVRMKNWNKKIYAWKGATIVLNLNTLEIWLRSRYYNPTKRASGVMRLIYSNWSKADLFAREFSEFAQIALKSIKSVHPTDIQHAHLVMTTKALNPILKPMSKVKDDVGLIFDKSHPSQPEFTGEKSVEGAHGAEWFFTKFPSNFAEFTATIFEYKEQLKLHLEVERNTLETLKEIRNSIKKAEKEAGK